MAVGDTAPTTRKKWSSVPVQEKIDFQKDNQECELENPSHQTVLQSTR